MFTEQQIDDLLKSLGELYAENAKLKLINKVLQNNHEKMTEVVDRISAQPKAKKETKAKKEVKLFKEEPKPVTNNLGAFIGNRLDGKGDWHAFR